MSITSILIVIEMFFTIIIGLYFLNALKGQQSNKTSVKQENKKEMENLIRMRNISLTVPLCEKSRPVKLEDVIGQEKGIEALKAAICGPNPQHVIIYGPPGIGKTAAARLVLEYAKHQSGTPFKANARFVEIDATSVRFDERGIADPLMGSVHDPIFQGAGPLGIAGIPQPKPGAVTKAHGGILFLDEIGELHPIEMNKLLKVLEDRKVFLESAYYNSEDSNMPTYIKEVFENGLPADFRLIGATTRNPEEIPPALRSRCVEIFFRALNSDEMENIIRNTVKNIGVNISEKAVKLSGKYTSNGRDAVNLIQLAFGIALNDKRVEITVSDVETVIENGQYTPRYEIRIKDTPQIGYVNGLAVYGANNGAIMEIEATAKEVKLRRGNLRITGIVEEEEFKNFNSKLRRKSTARCSVENSISVLERIYSINFDQYDIHINFPGGTPVDGPSAGISIATAIYSAVTGLTVDNKVAMTGEISLHGNVKPIGGVRCKISAAIKAGVKRIIIPVDNYETKFSDIREAEIIPVKNINEVIALALVDENTTKESIKIEKANIALTAKGAS